MRKIPFGITVIAMILILTTLISGCGAPKTAPAQEAVSETQTTKTFAYVANMLSHEFYQRCIKGMQKACDDDGIKLLIADSNSDVSTQANHIETYAGQKDIDLLLISPIDPAAIEGAVKKAAANNIQSVTESNTVLGAATMVGGKWYDNGMKMGEWAGKELVNRGWEGNVLIIGFPAFTDTAAVEKGFTEAIQAQGAKINKVVSVDGQAFKEKSLQVATDALTANPDINVIMGINDDSILGAIQAAKAVGLDPAKMITMTHGFEGNPACVAMFDEGTLTGGYALFPEIYGVSMVEAGIKALAGEKLPELYESPMMLLTQENGKALYTKVGDEYQLDIDAVKKAMNQ